MTPLMKYILIATFTVKLSVSLWSSSPLIAFIFQHSNNSNSAVGIYSSISGITSLCIGPLVGILNDSWRGHNHLRDTGVIGGVTMFCSLYLFHYYSNYLAIFTYFMWGVFNAFFEVSTSTLFAHECTNGNRVIYESYRSRAMFLALCTGPLLNCVFCLSNSANSWDNDTLVRILCFGNFLSFFCLIPLFLSPKETENNNNMNQSLLDSVKSKKDSRMNKYIISLILIQDIVTALGSGMTVRYFPLWFKNELSISPFFVEFYGFFSNLSVVLFTRLFQNYSTPLHCFMIRFSAVFLLFFISLFSFNNYTFLLPLFLCGIRLGLMNSTRPQLRSILMDNCPPEYRGRVNAIDMVRMASWAGSAALGGFLVDQWDYQTNFFATACVHSVGLVLLFILYLICSFKKLEV